MTINDRLKDFVKYLGISQRKFTSKCGISEGSLRNGESLNGTGLAKVKKTYPELNLLWVFYGEGSMVLNTNQVNEEGLGYGISPSIDDIVNQKIDQAKEELQKYVGDFVREFIKGEIESELEQVQKRLKNKVQ